MRYHNVHRGRHLATLSSLIPWRLTMMITIYLTYSNTKKLSLEPVSKGVEKD
jgi:hypothetical protein